ncbi:class II aldolase/adducin family protein [Planosporangium flavigriseum]|uniref:Fuculose phosphate aldolase n=1 Tax=Planosporangium flavigriseum TaxID=373681 RepID=A0A8J3PJ70_9ACTN|nr:class II aldolase/adducin family protein [Planosporangium flavigriseum]NJC64532.1 class II aldolase/adducin family protein [Planosporangium flavigriseum]GIG71986.1 fuculose phosphate aldolase [Planosporangium flavigriseum]
MNYSDGDPRDQLTHVGSEVVRAGLVVGSGGNLSARGPGTEDFWVTAAGAWLDRLERSAFVRVRTADAKIAADASHPPTSELPLHLAIYRRRPDVAAIVHLHPQAVLLLDALREPIRLVTTDHAFYLRRIVTTPFRLPGTAELADEAAAATADGTNCVILSHHGCSVLADSVELAHKRALYLEEAARLTYQALVLGRADALPACPPEFLRAVETGTQTTA